MARQTADARRDALVAAAVKHFARTGLHGTAVSAITDEVGITQPYAFSLFKTKKGLFLAALDHGFDHLETIMREAGEGEPGETEERLHAMGDRYSALIAEERDWLLLQMPGYAACSDDDVRELVRGRYARLWSLVEDVSGGDDERVTQFFATGMLINVAAVMDLPEVLDGKGEWLKECLPAATAAAGGAPAAA